MPSQLKPGMIASPLVVSYVPDLFSRCRHERPDVTAVAAILLWRDVDFDLVTNFHNAVPPSRAVHIVAAVSFIFDVPCSFRVRYSKEEFHVGIDDVDFLNNAFDLHGLAEIKGRRRMMSPCRGSP